MGNRLATQGGSVRGALAPRAAAGNAVMPAPPTPPSVLQRLNEHDNALGDHHSDLRTLEARVSAIEQALGIG